MDLSRLTLGVPLRMFMVLPSVSAIVGSLFFLPWHVLCLWLSRARLLRPIRLVSRDLQLCLLALGLAAAARVAVSLSRVPKPVKGISFFSCSPIAGLCLSFVNHGGSPRASLFVVPTVVFGSIPEFFFVLGTHSSRDEDSALHTRSFCFRAMFSAWIWSRVLLSFRSVAHGRFASTAAPAGHFCWFLVVAPVRRIQL